MYKEGCWIKEENNDELMQSVKAANIRELLGEELNECKTRNILSIVRDIDVVRKWLKIRRLKHDPTGIR
jgi:hypothetical protein